MVRLLLSHGASLEAEDATSGDAALHNAARTGNWEMVLFLLDHGAEVNQFNKLGETALHIAVKDGRTAIAALLMDHGADVEECVRRSTVGFSRVLISDTRQVFQQIGQNPLHLATGRGDLQLASLLADRCVNLEALNTTGQTALHIAARFGRLELVDMFLDRDVPVDLLDQDGRTPLHWAAFHNKAAVPHLLSRGADPNAVAKNGMTPLHWASMSLYCDSVILLLNQGAYLHAISHDGTNALGCVLIDCELRYNLCRNHLLIAQELCARGLKIRHVEKRLSDRQVDLLSTILQYQASFERGELSRVII